MPEILKEYFNTSNYRSFVRQLNFYGFKKGRKGADKFKFDHPNFSRGRTEDFQKVVKLAPKTTRIQKPDKVPKKGKKSMKKMIEKLMAENRQLTQDLDVGLNQIRYLFNSNQVLANESRYRECDLEVSLSTTLVTFFIPLIEYHPYSMGAIERALVRSHVSRNFGEKINKPPMRLGESGLLSFPKHIRELSSDSTFILLKNVIFESGAVENGIPGEEQADMAAQSIRNYISRLQAPKSPEQVSSMNACFIEDFSPMRTSVQNILDSGLEVNDSAPFSLPQAFTPVPDEPQKMFDPKRFSE